MNVVNIYIYLIGYINELGSIIHFTEISDRNVFLVTVVQKRIFFRIGIIGSVQLMSFHITIKSCTPSDPKTKAKVFWLVTFIGSLLRHKNRLK